LVLGSHLIFYSSKNLILNLLSKENEGSLVEKAIPSDYWERVNGLIRLRVPQNRKITKQSVKTSEKRQILAALSQI